MNIQNYFAVTAEQQELVQWIGDIADRYADGAVEADEHNHLNTELIQALKDANYHTFSVPQEYGGKAISLTDFLLCQERIAQVDAPTAIAIGWHHISMFNLAQSRAWDEAVFADLCRDVVEHGALINRADSEAATGSPSRGGKPQTKATRSGENYILNGRKSFTTMSPMLDYFLISATLEPDGNVADFLIPRTVEGVSIDPVWDMVGMRGTASHNLVLENVMLPAKACVGIRPNITPDQPRKWELSAYMMNIPASYLGIAIAARQHALDFASTYQPNSVNEPIIHLPHIQQKLGQLELELTTARHFMYAVANRWDIEQQHVLSAGKGSLSDYQNWNSPDIAAVKTVAIQAAISVTDQAMRIVGAHSLAMSHPLQRLYRDVRFGLHNPPMDDVTITQLAQRAIRSQATKKIATQ